MVRLYHHSGNGVGSICKPRGILHDDNNAPGRPAKLQTLVLTILESVGRPLSRNELLPLIYAVGRRVHKDRLTMVLVRMRRNGSLVTRPARSGNGYLYLPSNR